MLVKFGRWSWKDLYLLPAALLLWPMVVRNYRLRRVGAMPDEWYAQDAWLFHHGYVVK